MKGRHKVLIEAGNVRFEFEIKHKFNIILGRSGEGKTYLCDILAEGSDKVKIRRKYRSDLNAISLSTLSALEGHLSKGYNLIFVDEAQVKEICEGDAGQYFGQLVKGKPVYFVFMSRRRSFTSVPFNVDACYNFKHEYRGGKTVISTEPLYEWIDESPMSPNTVIIEDSKVGFYFYRDSLKLANCISAHGNSNVITAVESALDRGSKSIFVIADGCGFGVYFDELVKLKHTAKSKYGADLRLFLPQSFEYLVLISEIFKIDWEVINHMENFATLENYMGWEAAFTDYLVNRSKGKYSKSGRSLPYFLTDTRNIKKIKGVINELTDGSEV